MGRQHQDLPPRLPSLIPKLLLNREDYREFSEDLAETYRYMLPRTQRRRAACWYWLRILESIPWMTWQQIEWRFVMLKNNFKLALRTLRKEKFHSLLNITGLATGIAFAVICLLLIQNELSYDRYHQKHDRIYRYGVNMTIGGRSSTQSGCNMAVGPLLQREIPEIEAYVRFLHMGEIILKYGDNSFLETNFEAVDGTVFDVFSYEFIYGQPADSLTTPDSMVLTEKTARKLFGSRNPVGESVEIAGQGLFTVTGVIQDVPQNSHVTFDGLISLSTLFKNIDPTAMLNPKRLSSGMSFSLYFLFAEHFTEEQFQLKFQTFYDREMAESDSINYKSVVEPLADIYLHSKIWEQYSSRNRAFLISFSAVGFFILLLACINYINLATSRFGARTREIGMKKVIGAEKGQLLMQFLSESLILSFLSLMAAFLLVLGIFKTTSFNTWIQKDLQLNLFSNPVLLIGSLLIALVTGIVSGLYPAFYLSRVAPARLFRKSTDPSRRVFNLRNILVTFQFIISIGIFAMTFLMKNQLHFIHNYDLGIDRENIVLVSAKDTGILPRMKALKEELNQTPGVISSALSNASPGFGITGWAHSWERDDGAMEGHAFRHMQVDDDYFATMGIQIVRGRNFTVTEPWNGRGSTVVNQALVKHMGWENPIGKRYDLGTVVGVVRDFNYFSLHEEIRPMYITLPAQPPAILNVKMEAENILRTLEHIKATWHRIMKDTPIHLEFLSDEVEQLYINDHRQMRLAGMFAYVCILVCCLGLLGLTSYSVERRTREIAVRKVLGASLTKILLTLFKPVAAVLLVALVITVPLAYWLAVAWLNNFAYKTTISPFVFLLSGLAAALLAFFTASYHSIGVARKNPADTLKHQ